MKVEMKVDDRMVEVEISDESYSAIVEQLKPNNRVSAARRGDVCYQVHADLWYNIEHDDATSEWVRSEHEYYNDEALAKHVYDQMKLYQDMMHWREENDPVRLDWNNPNEFKWLIRYDPRGNSFYPDYWRTYYHPGMVYFSSQAKSKECYDQFKDRIAALANQII